MIEINGAYGEGGGQILRTSLTLSALTSHPLQIDHIRANRSKPGLRPQHLAAVKAIATLTNAQLVGASRDSQKLTINPIKIRSGRFQFDINTAGALSLVLQTIYLPLSFADGRSEVKLSGGTHVQWSPIYHYLEQAWLPLISALGYRVKIQLNQAGFYPRGGGRVHLDVRPVEKGLPFICPTRGKLVRVRGISGSANLESHVAKRQKHQAMKKLYAFCQDVKIQTIEMDSPGTGSFILLKAEFDNQAQACYTALGARGKRAEKVADEAVNQLVAFLKTDGTVDQYLADQLLLPLAVIEGRSIFRTSQVTQHLLTNAHIIQQFLPIKISIDGELNQPGQIIVEGMRIA